MTDADHNKPSCIILAGGRGSRMHDRDKGLVEFEGRPLIEHVIERISAQVDDIIISANRNRDAYLKYTQDVLEDRPDWSYQGPLAGIASCLPACRHELVLVVSCDMPTLPAGLAHRLSSAIDNRDISICEVDNRLQPVLLIRRSCLDSLVSAIEQRQLGLMRWIESRPHSVVRFDDETDSFTNINTPADLG